MSVGHAPATVKLGDLEVKRMGFGAMQLPGPRVWGEPKDPARARKVLQRVIELGINLIDTSWYYGPYVSNRLIAEVLHPYPKGLVIATKLGGRRTEDAGWAAYSKPEELRKGCEEDLRLLKIERTDVTHLRVIGNGDVPFRESLDAMIAMQKEGKIRHIGLSNVTLEQLRDACSRVQIVSVQNLYNVFQGEKSIGSAAHAEVAGQEEVVDYCAEKGIAFLPFFPLAIPGPKGRGNTAAVDAVAKKLGITQTQAALAWLMARSPTMTPIPGTSSPEHLDENWSAYSVKLEPEDVAAIAAARE